MALHSPTGAMTAGKKEGQSGHKQLSPRTQKKSRLHHSPGKGAEGVAGLARKEVANSNSTMHAFLGGRQKSWMTPGMSPTISASTNNSSQRPKTASSPNVVAPLPLGSKTNSNPVEKRLTSTSTFFPPASQPLSQTKDVIPPAQENILPSPAPSEDVATPDAPTHQEAQVDRLVEEANGGRKRNIATSMREAGQKCRTDQGTQSEQVITGASHTTLNAVPGGDVPMERRSNLGLEFRQSPTTYDPRGNHVQLQPASASVTSQNHVDPNVQEESAQNKRRRISTPAEARANPSILQQSPSLPRSDGVSLPKPGPASSTLQMRTFLPALADLIRQAGGPQKLAGTPYLRRIELLQQACINEDHLFLTFHQMACMEALHPGMMGPFAGFDIRHKNGLDQVTKFVDRYVGLPATHPGQFASFPIPLDHLLQIAPFYHEVVRNVRDFLLSFPANVPKLQQRVCQRDCPPVAHEIASALGAHTVTFQMMVFRACYRNLWGPRDNEWFPKIEAIFCQDQRHYFDILSRVNTARPVPPGQAKELEHQTLSNYRTLRAQQLRTEASLTQPRVPASMVPTPNAQLGPDLTPNPSIHSQQFATQRPQAEAVLGNTHLTQRQVDQAQRQPGRELQINIPAPHQFMVPASPASATVGQPPSLYGAHQHRLVNDFSPRMRQQTQTGQNNVQQVRPAVHVPVQISQQAFLPHSAYVPSPRPRGSVSTMSSPRLPVSIPQTPNSAISSKQGPTPFQAVTLQQHQQGQHGVLHNRRASDGRQPVVDQEQLLMPPGPLAPNTYAYPNPAVTAMHQAHVRSPRLMPLDQHENKVTSTRLYRFIQGFALRPSVMPTEVMVTRLPFSITKETLERIPKEFGPPDIDARPVWTVREGTLMFRIRSCVIDTADEPQDASQWVVKDITWPQHIFLNVNEVHLEVRRKSHHGRDLEIDITRFIREGSNSLNYVILKPEHEKKVQYAIAVEAIGFRSHTTIVHQCTHAPPIPAEKTLNQIKASLASDPVDEELTIVSSQVTVSVTDPFTSRIFEIPVRGLSCRHRDCFDLETFLQTRKTGSPHDLPWQQQTSLLLSKQDGWRCPLCGADARPGSLRIDGFMRDVRRRLEHDALLDTKAIIVRQDGSWAPKPVTKETTITDAGAGHVGSSANGGPTPTSAHTRTTSSSEHRTIIELDD